MAIYRAEFRWQLPPQPTTVERFAEALSTSTGCPCGARIVRDSADDIAALLSFPFAGKNNFVALSSDLCQLEFAPTPFFWAHAAKCVQELGGAFTKPVLSDRPDWIRRRWSELKWTERSLIRFGFGASVV